MRAVVIALMLAAMPGATAAQDAAPITKAEARAMTPQALTRRLFGDASRFMVPFDNERTLLPTSTSPLRRLSFLTTPLPDFIPGLCGTQRVDLYFEQVGQSSSAETQVRPAGMEVSQLHLIRNLSRIGERPAYGQRPSQQDMAECAAVDPLRAHLFRASSSYTVPGTIARLRALIEAARAGRDIAPIACESFAQPCHAALAGLRPEEFDAVDACGDQCEEVQFEHLLIRLTLNSDARTIERVELVQLIPVPPSLD
jgi:hypothetical protein